jgi:hypothetical protein
MRTAVLTVVLALAGCGDDMQPSAGSPDAQSMIDASSPEPDADT